VRSTTGGAMPPSTSRSEGPEWKDYRRANRASAFPQAGQFTISGGAQTFIAGDSLRDSIVAIDQEASTNTRVPPGFLGDGEITGCRCVTPKQRRTASTRIGPFSDRGPWPFSRLGCPGGQLASLPLTRQGIECRSFGIIRADRANQLRGPGPAPLHLIIQTNGRAENRVTRDFQCSTIPIPART